MTFDIPKTDNKQNTKHSSNNKKYYKKSGDVFTQLFKSNNQPKKVFASEDDKIQFVNTHYEDHIYKKTYAKQSTRKYSKDSDNYSTSNEDYPSSSSNHFKSKADDFKIKYKTELCKYFEINGYCKFGDNVSLYLFLYLHIYSVLMLMEKKIYVQKLLKHQHIERRNVFSFLKMVFVLMEIDVNLHMLLKVIYLIIPMKRTLHMEK